jgi:[ribosomal protein S18]-alanine N-acetyltransferase
MSAATPAVALRPAVLADIDAILEIERASFPDPPWSRSSFVVLLDDPRVSFLVATAAGGAPRASAGEVLGYVVTWIVADEGEIANLAVRTDRRRAGIGRALVDAAITAAIGGGARSLYLEVRESNAGARALYERRGFAAIGTRAKYYRNPSEDALILRLDPSSGPDRASLGQHRPARRG